MALTGTFEDISFGELLQVLNVGHKSGRLTVRRGAEKADIVVKDGEVFRATADCQYPDPLLRLWRAHFSLAQHTPDVIISLADQYYAGSKGFDVFVSIASTHGGLNKANSTTFIMSTAGPLPPLMRSADISPNVTRLLHRPWPAKKP